MSLGKPLGDGMVADFRINDIYDKNINFLIGSGASYGLLPTLALGIKGDDGKSQTIETLATFFDQQHDKQFQTLLFMHYYKECIEPAMKFDLKEAKIDVNQNLVLSNYNRFLDTLLIILLRRKNGDKNCNIFTTNYDGCFEHVADELLQQGGTDFVINDGARGFNRRYLQARNYNSFIYQTGVFERHRTDIPQINLIHLHGSVYWYKDQENIRIDYLGKNESRLIKSVNNEKITPFAEILNDDSKKISDLPKDINLSPEEITSFWKEYNKLPIVNPTKWKFYETVFEEHYYQMLRLMSYELEKPNAVFIIFGFSFADEHILNLVKRSLSNPTLQLFICCYNETGHERMQKLFNAYRNVQYIVIDEPLDFSAFNDSVFSLNPTELHP